ncbi:fimbrial protein [Herbaspirillum lusitanum]|uniref:fimbrial protein n=1 Tax=Herbaspirillum lusitanum TaxID=213312 RepID=UPI0012F4848A|nr:fimbrial protein [Herbaspirillum lusitanum]
MKLTTMAAGAPKQFLARTFHRAARAGQPALFWRGFRRRALNILLAGGLLSALLLPELGYAQTCRWRTISRPQQDATGIPWRRSFTLPATITVPRDAPAGTIIASSPTVTAPFVDRMVACDQTPTLEITPERAAGTVDEFTLRTEVPGIWIKIWARLTNAPSTGGRYVPLSGNELAPTYAFSSSDESAAATGRLDLIKGNTGVVTAGTINAGALSTVSVNGLFTYIATRLANRVMIVPQTCQVDTPNVVVPMGSVASSSFTGTGSVSPARNFTISVNCSGVASQVFMTLTDQQTQANRTSTLGLTAASSARGVGIQILRRQGNTDTPISFGADSSTAGNTNQFLAFSSTGEQIGATTIPFSARYIKTAATIIPGTANGVATFTMSYQ